MSSLSELRDRVEETLMDTGNKVWDTGAIDEAILKALDRYSEVNPLRMETVIDVIADGREIALNGVAGLLGVSDVWWPYDSDSDEEWPNYEVSFRLWWDDAQPVLFLSNKGGAQPQTDDEIRLWYTKKQTINGLDGEAVTTLPGEHETLIVIGAAGYAARSRGIDYADTAYPEGKELDYKKWSSDMLREFSIGIFAIKNSEMGGGMPQKGWQYNG